MVEPAKLLENLRVVRVILHDTLVSFFCVNVLPRRVRLWGY